MTNQEFIQEIANVRKNICELNGDFMNTKRWSKVVKLEKAVEEFVIEEIEEGNLYIDYDNRIIGYSGIVSIGKPDIVCPLMLMYTNFMYYLLQAKPYVDKELYEKLCQEKKRLGKAIRLMCTTEQTRELTAWEWCRIKYFIQGAEKQLHHYVGEVGKYSETVVPEDSVKLRGIREIYESFKVGTKYVTFYDEILEKKVQIPRNSPNVRYAIMLLFAIVYGKSVIFLKENCKTGHWCPLSPWQVLQEFQSLQTEIFFKHK